MSAYHCKHCGATANSKCARTRTVFPDDQMDALLSHVLKYKITINLTAPRSTEVSLFVHTPLEDEEGEFRSDAELVEWALILINGLKPEEIKNYSCNHEWVIDPGDECTIGCCISPTTKEGTTT